MAWTWKDLALYFHPQNEMPQKLRSEMAGSWSLETKFEEPEPPSK